MKSKLTFKDYFLQNLSSKDLISLEKFDYESTCFRFGLSNLIKRSMLVLKEYIVVRRVCLELVVARQSEEFDRFICGSS
jgi:hypothetical protein